MMLNHHDANLTAITCKTSRAAALLPQFLKDLTGTPREYIAYYPATETWETGLSDYEFADLGYLCLSTSPCLDSSFICTLHYTPNGLARHRQQFITFNVSLDGAVTYKKSTIIIIPTPYRPAADRRHPVISLNTISVISSARRVFGTLKNLQPR